MAGGRIAGITIEIGGDTTKLSHSLKGIDKDLKQTKNTLKDVDKLLKLDPTNTDLLRQKQKALKDAITQTKERLEQLKAAQAQVQEGTAEWDALQREIIATEQDLSGLEDEYREFGSVASQQLIAVGNKLQDVGGKVEEVGNKLKGFSAAGAAVVTALVGLGVQAANTADDLNTLAKQTGLTTAEIQKMQYAADLVDVSVETITGALSRMKKTMTGQPEVWEQLGVSVTNADGSMRSSTDVFYDVLQALSQIENETERDQLAMAVFGKGADELAGIIDDGGQALHDYGEEAEALGLILDQDVIDEMNDVNDQLDKSKAQLKAAGLQMGAKVGKVLIPIIEKIAAGIEKLTGWLEKLSPEQLQVIMTVASIIAVVAPLLIVIGKVIAAIGTAISLVGKVMTVLTAANPVVLIVIAVIAALVAIGIALYKNWDTIKAKAIELWNTIKEKFNAIKESVTTAIAGAKEAVVNKWNEMKTTVTETVENIKTGIAEKWDAIKTTVTTKVEAVKNAIVNKFNTMKATLQGIVNKIKSLFNFNWKTPKLKLPHLTITYEPANSAIAKFFGVTQIPHLSVEWYKKAMQNPVLFTSPTIVGTPYGAKGFGESGAEIVMGLDKLRELVGSQERNVNVQVVLQGDARSLFRVMSQTNNTRTRATGYNAFAMGV